MLAYPVVPTGLLLREVSGGWNTCDDMGNERR